MGVEEQEMFFFIADISGYTAYMLKNQMDITHGILIISQLMEALMKEVCLPLQISKLEGDAIFLYLPKDKMPAEYLSNPNCLGDHVLRFFQAFLSKLLELKSSTTCQCGGCSNIQKLNLKMVAHYGKAAIQQIGSFQELSGVDVILVHRLLKNQIQEKCYLMMTEPASQKIDLPSEGRLIQAEEEDKDLGKIRVKVYYPLFPELSMSIPKKGSFLATTIGHLKLMVGSLLLKLKIKKTLDFHNFPNHRS